MAWDSAHKTNLHKVHLKEKNAVCLICNETRFAHTHAVSTNTNIFLKRNIQKVSVFMHRVKTCGDVQNTLANQCTYLFLK